jgi:hypothetical protein
MSDISACLSHLPENKNNRVSSARGEPGRNGNRAFSPPFFFKLFPLNSQAAL